MEHIQAKQGLPAENGARSGQAGVSCRYACVHALALFVFVVVLMPRTFDRVCQMGHAQARQASHA
eukprot:scaffold145813_cov22-Tisochrysis_lutea.AAC.1